MPSRPHDSGEGQRVQGAFEPPRASGDTGCRHQTTPPGPRPYTCALLLAPQPLSTAVYCGPTQLSASVLPPGAQGLSQLPMLCGISSL